MPDRDYDTCLEAAVQAVRCAASLVRDQLGSEVRASFKPDGTPTTEIDVSVERAIREELNATYPGDSFVGEELAPKVGESAYEWCCDPLDGTWAFLNGEATVTTVLCMRRNADVLLSVVYNPITEELFTAGVAGPLERNGAPLEPRRDRELAQAILNLRLERPDLEYCRRTLELWGRREFGKLVVLGGSLAYGLALVATGVHDIAFGRIARPQEAWELLAGRKLVETAGGAVSCGQLEPFQAEGGAAYLIASGNKDLHAAFRNRVTGA